MYQAKTLQKYKERVSESLFDGGSICRVVFASTALGRGVNIPDVHQVIHYGPPRQIVDFVQEIGRAGRDGKPAKSLLFYAGGHLKKCEQIVKEYARTDTFCLQKLLLDKFGASTCDTNEPHNCCCICHLTCKCLGKSCKVELPSFVLAESNAATNLCWKHASTSFHWMMLLIKIPYFEASMLQTFCIWSEMLLRIFNWTCHVLWAMMTIHFWKMILSMVDIMKRTYQELQAMKVLLPQVLLTFLGSWNYNNDSSFSSTRTRLELSWIPDVLIFFCDEWLNCKWSNFKIRYLAIPVLYHAVNVVPNLYP